MQHLDKRKTMLPMQHRLLPSAFCHYLNSPSGHQRTNLIEFERNLKHHRLLAMWPQHGRDRSLACDAMPPTRKAQGTTHEFACPREKHKVLPMPHAHFIVGLRAGAWPRVPAQRAIKRQMARKILRQVEGQEVPRRVACWSATLALDGPVQRPPSAAPDRPVQRPPSAAPRLPMDGHPAPRSL